MKKRTQHLIAEAPGKRSQVELTIGIELGDVWSHYCTLNQQGEVIDRGRCDTWFTDVPHARVAIEAGVHSIWICEQLKQSSTLLSNPNRHRVQTSSDSSECEYKPGREQHQPQRQLQKQQP